MSEELGANTDVSIMAGVEGAEDINANPNPSTDTEGTWMSGMTDEQIGIAQNKGWEGSADLLKSYTELEKFRGASEDQLIRKPKEGESWDEVYAALGRPETVEDYVYNTPEGQDASIPDSLKEAFFNNGVSSAGYTEITDAYNEYVANSIAEQEQQAKVAQDIEISDLRRELGGDLDRKVAMADAAAVAMGFDQEQADALRGSLGVRGMLDVMTKIHDAIGEDTVNNSSAKSPYGQTKEQLVAEKSQLMEALKADPARATMFNRNTGDDYARMKQLNESIYG